MILSLTRAMGHSCAGCSLILPRAIHGEFDKHVFTLGPVWQWREADQGFVAAPTRASFSGQALTCKHANSRLPREPERDEFEYKLHRRLADTQDHPPVLEEPRRADPAACMAGAPL